VRSYLRSVQEFARYFNREPHQLGLEQVRQYTAYLFGTRKLSSSIVRQQVAALRFFYVNTFSQGVDCRGHPMHRAVPALVYGAAREVSRTAIAAKIQRPG